MTDADPINELKETYNSTEATNAEKEDALETAIQQLAEERENGLSESVLDGKLKEIKSITETNLGALRADIEEARESLGEEYDRDADLEGEPGWNRVRLAYDTPHVSRGTARNDLVQLLENRNRFMAATDDVNGNVDKAVLWMYNPDTGIYDENGSAYVSRLIEAKLPEHVDRREHTEVLAKLKRRKQVPRENFNAGDDERGLLCVNNGVLDPVAGELLDGGHSHEYRFTKGVPVTFDPDADCPNIDRFIESVVETDAEKWALYQLVGWCLSSGYKPQSIVTLIGDGSNGKGTFIRLLRDFLGTENYVGFDLHTLSKPGGQGNYSGAKLPGKMANIGGDIPGKKLSDLNRIKALSGGDAIEVREPYRNPVTFENEAKLIFAVNEPPIIPETGNQINRRFRHIVFPKKFTNEDDGNPDMVPESELGIHDEEEFSGLLNRSLDALADLRDTSEWAHVTDPAAHMDQYRELSDPISRFAAECLANVADSCVHSSAVYSTYKQWCAANDETVKAESTFSRALNQSEEFDRVKSRRTDHTGDQVYVLDTAAFTIEGRRYCPDDQLRESDSANNRIHGTNPDEIAERIGEDPDEIEHGERTHAGIHEEIFRAVDELDNPTSEKVEIAVSFGGFEKSRVENALRSLDERGELTGFGGQLMRTE